METREPLGGLEGDKRCGRRKEAMGLRKHETKDPPYKRKSVCVISQGYESSGKGSFLDESPPE